MRRLLKNFAVLICVYRYDDLDLFKQAIQSILENSHQPEKILLIVDGPVSTEMHSYIVDWVSVQKNFEVVWQQDNLGLTASLNHGLNLIKQDFVIRADSDDFNHPNRFLRLFEKITEGFDLVGSQANEMDQATATLFEKSLPRIEEKIIRYASMRNPFMHMTVCFDRKLALSVGGYPDIPFREDYGLWLKFLRQHARVANIDESLVTASWGNNFVDRRSGGSVLREEFKLLLLKIRCLPLHLCPLILFSFFCRVVSLLVGGKFLYFLYTSIIRKRVNF